MKGDTEFEVGRGGLEERYNGEDALATGMFLNAFFRHADVVKLANMAQLVNVIAPIVTRKNGIFLQTIYWPLLEYGKQRGARSLDALVTAPSYDLQGEHLSYLDVSATWDAKARRLSLNVLNRSAKQDLLTRIDNVEGKLHNQAEAWELNAPDLKAAATFEDDQRGRPVHRTVAIDSTGRTFLYKFPAHSLTILTLQVD